MPHLNDRLAAYLCCEIIPVLGRLAFMTDKYPDIGKKVLHFQRIDILTGINIAVHLMVLNKPFDILCVKRFVGLHLHLHLPPVGCRQSDATISSKGVETDNRVGVADTFDLLHRLADVMANVVVVI